MTSRIGASSLAKMDPEILVQLEAGAIETATLTEGLAINMARLMSVVLPDAPVSEFNMDAGVVQRMAQGGALLLQARNPLAFRTHASDTVRGWAAFGIGQDVNIEPLERIDAILPFAADKHFGVREWAWMAIRAIIVADPIAAIERLTPWADDADPNVRRFASEATRPRGVWAASIPILRRAPVHGLAILERLRFDDTRYVEDSVANWLNDAAKDNADWVATILVEWESAGVSKRLVKRASRSLI